MEQGVVREWHFGTHRMRFDPPDLVHIVWKGAVTGEHTKRVLELVDALEAPKLFILVDISESGIPSPRDRQVMSEARIYERLAGMAIVGAGYSVRTVMAMLLRAARLLTKQSVNAAFFRTEAEGRAWLAAERARLA